MKASLDTGRIACGLHFGYGNHAGRYQQRQDAGQRDNHAIARNQRIFRKAEWSFDRSSQF
jgi:hypothetical protein